MTRAADILAELGNAIELIVFLAVVVISALGGLIQKWLQRREQQAAEQRTRSRAAREEGRSEQQDRQQPRYKPIGESPPARGDERTEAPQRQAPQTPRAAPARARPAPGADHRLKRQAERIMRTGEHAVESEQPPPPFPRPDRGRIETAAPAPRSAAAGRRARLAAARKRRQQQAAAEQSIADTELGAQHEGGAVRRGPVPQIAVDLADADKARRAIVYHEILGPPKALSFGQELWAR
ncbi:MAG: hypothetical protein ACOC8F_05305 [Planctomycetota bacterium]